MSWRITFAVLAVLMAFPFYAYVVVRVCSIAYFKTWTQCVLKRKEK